MDHRAWVWLHLVYFAFKKLFFMHNLITTRWLFFLANKFHFFRVFCESTSQNVATKFYDFLQGIFVQNSTLCRCLQIQIIPLSLRVQRLKNKADIYSYRTFLMWCCSSFSRFFNFHLRKIFLFFFDVIGISSSELVLKRKMKPVLISRTNPFLFCRLEKKNELLDHQLKAEKDRKKRERLWGLVVWKLSKWDFKDVLKKKVYFF